MEQMVFDLKPPERREICACCGAKVVEYRHTFSHALAVGLWRLYTMGGGPLNIEALSLTRNQWDNFQKLRYWGLVMKAVRDDGTRIGGAWRLTTAGRSFIEDGTGIRNRVWTYRGDTVRFEGDQVFFADVHEPGYEQRHSYAANSRPHGKTV